jgi:hypothetical protein
LNPILDFGFHPFHPSQKLSSFETFVPATKHWRVRPKSCGGSFVVKSTHHKEHEAHEVCDGSLGGLCAFARVVLSFLRDLRGLRGQILSPRRARSTRSFGSLVVPVSQRFLFVRSPWRPLHLCASHSESIESPRIVPQDRCLVFLL